MPDQAIVQYHNDQTSKVVITLKIWCHLQVPSQDEKLKAIDIPEEMYPEISIDSRPDCKYFFRKCQDYNHLQICDSWTLFYSVAVLWFLVCLLIAKPKRFLL